MALTYIYKLSQAEKEELENINWNALNESIDWINKKLQEAFDEGRKHPIEGEEIK